MQTFLPYGDFAASAAVLDPKRLGKQRVEVLQLLNTFLPGRALTGWRLHPARIMWEGHTAALAHFGVVVCDRWISLGFADTCRGKILAVSFRLEGASSEGEALAVQLAERYVRAMKGEERGFLPFWFGDEAFHGAHRSNLLRKDPSWYGRFGWTEPPDLPYVWPGPSVGAQKGAVRRASPESPVRDGAP